MGLSSSQPTVARDAIRRVLVIRPRFLGDICMTTPVLSRLREIVPHAELHYLAEDESAPLLADDPRLSRLWVHPRRGPALATARLMGELRAARFDLVLDLFCNPRTALWTAATGARWRVGYPDKRFRSAAYNVAVRPTEKSAVLFHLASLAALGWEAPYTSPRVYLTDGERAAAWNHLAENGVPAGATLVGFHPGARWPTRRWAAEDFAALGRLFLAARPRDWLVVFGGASPDEQELARTIVARVANPRALAIAGVAVRRFAALAQLCRAFVAGDSGPVHVATAVGTPTIGLFGRNEPERFFPYLESEGHRALYARVWCSPCHKDVCDHLSCLRAISPDWAWDALLKTLEAPEPASRAEALRGASAGPVPTFVLGAAAAAAAKKKAAS